MPRITPSLWFDNNLEEAAEFYSTVFSDFKITSTSRYGEGAPMPAGTVLAMSFEISGQPFMGINGGPHFTFNEAVSFTIDAPTQADIDYYWNALTDGGMPSQCGWLVDRFGLSWQVVPPVLSEILGGPDADGAARAMTAMLGMSKLDIAELQRAYDGS